MSFYASSVSGVVQQVVVGQQPPPPGGIEQIVFVIMENLGLSSALSYSTFSGLASQGFLFNNWSKLSSPSQPNYTGIAFGDTFGISSDGVTTPLPAPTLLDLVANSGRSWAVIQAGSPFTSGAFRGADHDAFLLESPAPPGGVIPLPYNGPNGDTANVISQVNSGTNFVWFTPDDNMNGHDPGEDWTYANSWYASWLPALQQAMAPRKSLLITTTDEDSPLVYTCFSGNAARRGSSMVAYNHYSFGRLIETIWGGSGGLRNCDSAPNPTEGLV